MNLALLDPFRRHIPDRIDSTLTIPRALHPFCPQQELTQNSSAGGGDANEEDEQQNEVKVKKRSDSHIIDGGDEVSESLLQGKPTDEEDEGGDRRKDTTEEETKPKKRKKDTGKHEGDEEDQYWTACYNVSFNRRGTALASAHASGLVPIYDFISRTTSAVYWPPPPISLSESDKCASLGMENGLQFSGTFNESGQKKKRPKITQGRCGSASNKQLTYVNGVTSLSWDRHNRTLLAGAIGDYNLRLMDNYHPQVSLDCAEAAKREWMTKQAGKEEDKNGMSDLSIEPPPVSVYASFEKFDGEIVGLELQTSSWGRGRLLLSNVISSTPQSIQCVSSSAVLSSSPTPKCSDTTAVQCMRHPTLILELPQPLGGPAQLHPFHNSIGLACLADGSLVLFWIPPIAFYETLPASLGSDNDSIKDAETLAILKSDESRRVGNIAFLTDPPQSQTDDASYFITCAAFGKNGTDIFAATKCGLLLAFTIPPSMIKTLRGEHGADLATNFLSHKVKPSVSVKVPGAVAAWQIILSRNGKYALINSADCALRLYDTEEILRQSESDVKQISPRFVFQDTLSRSPWASCDFSADGEYVVGGCNSYPQPGDNYNLFMWNTITGELVDQLKGPQASLYSLSCHPTRSFIAVGTSDGVIDIYGPRVQWAAFAPDFQARQANVLYEEKEDEFDIVDNNEGNAASENKEPPEEGTVDVITVDKTAAGGSDSEEEIFYDVRVLKLFSEKSKPKPEM